MSFPACRKRKVEAEFSGGEVTSDGGMVLIRGLDRRLGLTAKVAQVLADPRELGKITHRAVDLVRQRIFGLAAGYEDLNDHDTLRHDPGFQTAVEREEALASSPTLCRFEQWGDRRTAWELHRMLVEQFIASQRSAPAELMLDFDGTDDPVHGKQVGSFFHKYYDGYCFLPLYVFCGDQLLVSYLRPGNSDGAKHAWAILALLVRRLRQAWPDIRIIFRGDGGFCRHHLMSWCERQGIKYVIGLAKNAVLLRKAGELLAQAATAFAATKEKQRFFAEFQYQAKSWHTDRRVIAKAEHTAQGSNPRFVVTNLTDPPQDLYDTLYCARGESENRIKEQQLDLFADRTSCHRLVASQFRLLLSGLAYTLVEALRRLALTGTELAQAYCGTIRLKLLKIGAVVVRNTRRVRFLLSSACPFQDLFGLVAARLRTG
ncbi:MAG: IS1380 family transposase [Blastocatellia bacterium]|nr:IS1380 family transposase [Blastocatellia bacterium]